METHNNTVRNAFDDERLRQLLKSTQMQPSKGFTANVLAEVKPAPAARFNPSPMFLYIAATVAMVCSSVAVMAGVFGDVAPSNKVLQTFTGMLGELFLQSKNIFSLVIILMIMGIGLFLFDAYLAKRFSRRGEMLI
ncbi:MAG: hypothetical protein JW783_09370 [Bacteroidales bacterium]|nr:hypothetical protein [Bacteroidales bacterium]MBN2748036.1 hypothetical protein [Bacteroidales bacterium]